MIVDDEPLARRALVDLCGAHGDLEIVAEAESGAAAVDAIRSHSPDVVLMDVELQDMSGFDVLRQLDTMSRPATIMVTAHPQHAVTAFDIDAFDYLTKPVDLARFRQAMGRVKRRKMTQAERDVEQLTEVVRAAITSRTEEHRPAQRLIGEKGRRLHFLGCEQIDYIEANGNYVNIHVGNDQYIARNTMKHLSGILLPHGFVRIDRSLLVNFKRIAYAERRGHGEFTFTLANGKQLISTRPHRPEILEALRCGDVEATIPT
jgi:two-component system LytT family response regulator